jgi:SAM-dependent methyltransferase
MAKDVVVFDGEEFRISKSQLIKPSLTTQLIKGSIALTVLAVAAKFGWLWPTVPVTLLGLAATWYAACSASHAFSNWFGAKLIPALMPIIDKQFKNVRKELLKGIRGRVLDVGSGSGLYIQYAALSDHVTEYIAMEPNTGMHPKIRENSAAVHPKFPVRIIGGYLEHIKESQSFDSIILGNVMCEIPDQEAGMREVARLLKPGGRVYFSEHVIEEKPSIARAVQQGVNWWWVVVTAGCHCNRRTLHNMTRVWQQWPLCHWSFEIGWVGPVTRMEIGIAVKPKQTK